MRVCIVISGDLWGGAEAVAVNIAQGLSIRAGITVEAILFNEGRLAEEFRSCGIPVSIMDESEQSLTEIARNARKRFRRMQPDIVHTHGHKENVVALLATFGMKRIRLVTTQHGMPEIYRSTSRLRQGAIARANFFLMAKCFDGVVTVSRNIRDVFLLKYGFHPDRVRTIHNGISPPPILRNRNSRAVVIGSCGRFYPVKEYPLMVEVARHVVSSCPSVQFELSGDGPERERIETSILRNNLDGQFIIRGFLNDVAVFYKGIDIYLNTSSHEGSPMSILEAMGWGVPIVAPRVGGIRDIIRDGVDGFLVDGREPHFFSEPCIHLIRDPDLRKKMGAAARERVTEAFSASGMIEKYLEMFRNLLC